MRECSQSGNLIWINLVTEERHCCTYSTQLCTCLNQARFVLGDLTVKYKSAHKNETVKFQIVF